MSNKPIRIFRNMRLIRHQKGMSIKNLMVYTGVPEHKIKFYEEGIYLELSKEDLEKIAFTLETSVEDLTKLVKVYYTRINLKREEFEVITYDVDEFEMTLVHDELLETMRVKARERDRKRKSEKNKTTKAKKLKYTHKFLECQNQACLLNGSNLKNCKQCTCQSVYVQNNIASCAGYNEIKPKPTENSETEKFNAQLR